MSAFTRLGIRIMDRSSLFVMAVPAVLQGLIVSNERVMGDDVLKGT